MNTILTFRAQTEFHGVTDEKVMSIKKVPKGRHQVNFQSGLLWMYSVAMHQKVMLLTSTERRIQKDRAIQILQGSLVTWLTIYVASERGGIR